MSRIDDLIAELAPKGVEFVKLKDLASLQRGKRLVRNQLLSSGEIPVYQNSMTPLGYYREPNVGAGSTFIIAAGAAGEIGHSDVDFWAADDVYFYPKINDIDQKYLYYVLQSKSSLVKSRVRRASIPRLPKNAIEDIRIPVPPLEVQREIVRVLDQFTQLEAELEAELEARRRQYEYYRAGVFRFSAGDDVRWSTLGGVSAKVSSGGTPASGRDAYYGGDIPWLRTQEVDFGPVYRTGMSITEEGLRSSSAKWIPEHCVIVAMYGATAAKVAINEIPLTTNQACCNLQIDPAQAEYRYVFFWIASQYERLKSLGEGSQSNLNARKVKDFPIPVPSLEEQRRIVSLLDKFDALVNDISVGLPTELAARRKQYEYYRDKLLTFEEALA